MSTSAIWRRQRIERLSGRHILGILAGFFGIVFAVNGFFIYRALSTHSGEVASEPYAQGLAYNDRIAAAVRQQRPPYATAAFRCNSKMPRARPLPVLHCKGASDVRPQTGRTTCFSSSPMAPVISWRAHQRSTPAAGS